jgi:hypothetical protein
MDHDLLFHLQVTLLGTVLLYRHLPETGGLTLEEVMTAWEAGALTLCRWRASSPGGEGAPTAGSRAWPRSPRHSEVAESLVC